MKRKGERKRKKVAQWKKGNPDQHEEHSKHRGEADMQTRCQLHPREAVLAPRLWA